MNVSLDRNFDYFLNSEFPGCKDGEWVAIYERKVISHGIELKNVIKETEKIAPLSKVLISKIKRTASYL